MSSETQEAEPIGWDAINLACKRVHGEQEPRHWGTILPTFLGGKDPLQGIRSTNRIYRVTEETRMVRG
jgi:hypothetical protein